MNTTKISLPLDTLCATAIAAARSAAAYIEGVDRNHIEAQHKASGSSPASQIVTAVDLQSESIIRDQLAASCEQWNIAFVGEESTSTVSPSADERHQKPYFWSVDPLDGTQAFVAGRPGYAVSIALVEQSGAPLIGVVCDPGSGDVIYAIKDRGAFINDIPFTTHAVATDRLTVFADRSFSEDTRHTQLLQTLEAVAARFNIDEVAVTYGNGAVKNACGALQSPAGCYIKVAKPMDGGGSIWDFSATACIARESQGWVSNVRGGPLDLNRHGSTFMNHQGVVYASSRALGQCLVDALASLAPLPGTS